MFVHAYGMTNGKYYADTLSDFEKVDQMFDTLREFIRYC